MHSLYTNSRVHKFNPQVSPLCTFCTQCPENIFHLFYGCNNVFGLIQSIRQWLATIGFNLDISKLKILFGKLDERPTSINNFILLSVKYFIWKCRLSSSVLSLEIFKKYLFSKLKDLKEALEYCDKIVNFQQWNNIFDCLSRSVLCTEQN